MSLADTIQQIEELREEIEAAGPISDRKREELWQKFRLEWNYNSNHIEGNTLTYGETKLLLMFGRTEGTHELREYEEMKAHDVAVKMIREWANEDRALTEADIKNLNQIILVEDFWKEAETPEGQETRRKIKVGSYKEYPNHVRTATGDIFRYAEPEEVPAKMQELIQWYRSEEALSLPSVVRAAELHYRFILIHPFDDGNGRVARLLVNYVLLKDGLPPLIIKSDRKKQYLTALNQADAGNREAFYAHLAEELLWSMELKLKAVRGKELEEEGDVHKKWELLKRKGEGNSWKEILNNELKKKILIENYIPLLDYLAVLAEELSEVFLTINYAYFVNGLDIEIESRSSDWLVIKRDFTSDIIDFKEGIGRKVFSDSTGYSFYFEFQDYRIDPDENIFVGVECAINFGKWKFDIEILLYESFLDDMSKGTWSFHNGSLINNELKNEMATHFKDLIVKGVQYYTK